MLCFCLGHDPCLDVFHVHLSSVVITANPIHDVFHVHHGPLVVFMKCRPLLLGSFNPWLNVCHVYLGPFATAFDPCCDVHCFLSCLLVVTMTHPLELYNLQILK
jgi:hypothetical protein